MLIQLAVAFAARTLGFARLNNRSYGIRRSAVLSFSIRYKGPRKEKTQIVIDSHFGRYGGYSDAAAAGLPTTRPDWPGHGNRRHYIVTASYDECV